MVVGFVRCAECDAEVRRADAILHRNPTGSRFFCVPCMKEEREAEARDADASGKIETDRLKADDPESAG